MAFLGIKIPSDIGNLLAQIDVPEKREPRDQYHVTMFHLGDDTPIEAITKAASAAFEVTSRTKPFQILTKLVTTFPKNPSGVPVICKVESPPLHDVHARLKAAFDKAGVEYSKKWPEYKPHITLAYAQEATPDQTIAPVSFTVGELYILGGNKGQDRLDIRLPLSMNTAALRVAARFQFSGPRSDTG